MTAAVVAIVAAGLAAAVAVVAVVIAVQAVRRAADPPFGRLHDWTGWEPLDEPGISDVHGGAARRCHVRCARCGEERDVWYAVDRDQLARSGGCPARAVTR